MKTSENLGNIAKALVAAQKEIKGVAKNAQGHGYKYMTFDAILALVKPILTKNGVFLIQNIKGEMVEGQNVACCETRLLHESGEWIESDTLIIKPVNVKAGAPTNPRDLGSALTYAKRYQLCGMIGVASDVDDDALVASQMVEWGLKITDDQKSILGALFSKKGIDKSNYSKICNKALGVIKATKECSQEEATKLIEYIESLPDAQK